MSLLEKITKDKESLVITGVIVAVSFLLLRRFFLKSEPTLVKANTKKVLSDGVIVSIPETKYAKYDLVIIFGGMYYATPEWMFSQIPTDGLYKNIVVIAPYTMSFDKAKSIYEPALKDYKIKSTSVMGFSAGGLQVQANYSPSWKTAGLIDPSTKSQYLELPFSDNVKMIYNNANWTGNLAGIGTVQTQLEPIIKKKGGFVEKVNISHESIPKYFFEKFLK
jgi:hypothetical protein